MVVESRKRDEDLVHEIEPAVQEELIKHQGKWVVLTRTHVIAIRETPADAYAAARLGRTESPILYHVPDPRLGFSYS